MDKALSFRNQAVLATAEIDASYTKRLTIKAELIPNIPKELLRM